MQLLIPNPKRKRKPRKAKARKRSKRLRAPVNRSTSPMARRRSSKQRTAPRKRSSRRRRSGGFAGGARRGFAFMPAGAVPGALATAGGFIGANFAVNKLAQKIDALRQPWGIVAGKAAVAAALFMFGRKFIGSTATALATGALVSGAVDAYVIVTNRSAGVSGMGYIGQPAGVDYRGVALLPAPAGEFDMSMNGGVGEIEMDDLELGETDEYEYVDAA